MSLDHISCTSGPLVYFRRFFRYLVHHVWPCPLMVPLCPVEWLTKPWVTKIEQVSPTKKNSSWKYQYRTKIWRRFNANNLTCYHNISQILTMNQASISWSSPFSSITIRWQRRHQKPVVLILSHQKKILMSDVLCSCSKPKLFCCSVQISLFLLSNYPDNICV